MAVPQLNSWWSNVDQDHVYLLCSYNWGIYGYDMLWSAQLSNYYNNFGNGYTPYFSVIGADYIYTYGSNNVSGAINAAGNAMQDMFNISVVEPIENVIMNAASTTSIDISNTFEHSQGVVMNYTITYNSNPAVCQASLTGTDIIINADLFDGTSQITVMASEGDLNADTSFFVTVCALAGDIDGNSEVDCFDASLVLHYVAGISPPSYPFPWAEWRIQKADINGNGLVEAYDASSILQYVVGLIGAL